MYLPPPNQPISNMEEVVAVVVEVAAGTVVVEPAVAAQEEAAREAEVRAVAARLPGATTATRTRSHREQWFRPSRNPQPRTSRRCMCWRKEPADSLFSTPTTCSLGFKKSRMNRMSTISWDICPLIRRTGVATLSRSRWSGAEQTYELAADSVT